MSINFIDKVFQGHENIELLICLTHDLQSEFKELYEYIRNNNIQKYAVFYQTGDYERAACFRGKIFRNKSKHRLHSKIVFVKYRRNESIKYKVVITSANLTRAGYSKNLEVIWGRDEMSRLSPIVIKTASYLAKYIQESGQAKNQNVKNILNELKRIIGNKIVSERNLMINGNASIQAKIKRAREIIIATPFFYEKNSKENAIFMNDIIRPSQKVAIITKYYPEGVPISSSFAKSMGSNLQVFAVEGRNLHGKMYIFRYADNSREMLIGSSNLTPGGIYKNYEANVLIKKLSARNIKKIVSFPKGRGKGRYLGENIVHVSNFGTFRQDGNINEDIKLEEYKEYLFQNLGWEARILKNTQEMKVLFNGKRLYGTKNDRFSYIKITYETGQSSLLTRKRPIGEIKLLIDNAVDIDDSIEFNVTACVKPLKQEISMTITISPDEYINENSGLQLLSILQGSENIKRQIKWARRPEGKKADGGGGDDITSGIDYVIKIGNMLAGINNNGGKVTGEQAYKLRKLDEYLQDKNNQPDQKLGAFVPVIKDLVRQYLADYEKTEI